VSGFSGVGAGAGEVIDAAGFGVANEERTEGTTTVDAEADGVVEGEKGMPKLVPKLVPKLPPKLPP